MEKKLQVHKVQQETMVFNWITNSPFSATLVVNQSFKRMKDVADHLNIYIPPRKCLGYFDGTVSGKRVAVCCPSLDLNKNSTWINRFSTDDEFFTEELISKESPAAFQKRIKRIECNDVNILRMLFVKKNGVYTFKGIYRLSAIDFDANSATYKRERLQINTQLKIRKVKISIEETTIETSTTL